MILPTKKHRTNPIIHQRRCLPNTGACTRHVSIRLRKRAIIWNSTGYHPTTTTNTKLCRSHRNTCTRKYEHITPVLRRLHWLPVRQRTLFKVLVFTYCALNATAPNYLVQLINHRNVTRTLRSSSSTELLFVPKSRTMMYGDRCFEVASPILWNNLPVSLRTAKCLTQFRSQLKTHLFKVSFYIILFKRM